MSKSVLSMAVLVVLLMGCGGGGKAGAGDYKLKVSVNPANGGSITIDPNMESYNEWADVEVTTTANKGYVFEGWSGDATDKSNSVTIKMSGSKNKKLMANFKTIPTFKDSRDGKTYEKVTISGKTWMAENLNFAAEGSMCYGDDAGNCEKYGRLYNWETALKACPAGFHLATDNEWKALGSAVGGASTGGTKLKSTTGWKENGNGTNDFGFWALPGGMFNLKDDKFYNAGYIGYWWSATKDESSFGDISSWFWSMDNEYVNVLRESGIGKTNLLSVRCVED